jgi:hypothetical protein
VYAALGLASCRGRRRRDLVIDGENAGRLPPSGRLRLGPRERLFLEARVLDAEPAPAPCPAVTLGLGIAVGPDGSALRFGASGSGISGSRTSWWAPERRSSPSQRMATRIENSWVSWYGSAPEGVPVRHRTDLCRRQDCFRSSLFNQGNEF